MSQAHKKNPTTVLADIQKLHTKIEKDSKLIRDLDMATTTQELQMEQALFDVGKAVSEGLEDLAIHSENFKE